MGWADKVVETIRAMEAKIAAAPASEIAGVIDAVAVELNRQQSTHGAGVVMALREGARRLRRQEAGPLSDDDVSWGVVSDDGVSWALVGRPGKAFYWFAVRAGVVGRRAERADVVADLSNDDGAAPLTLAAIECGEHVGAARRQP